jgi:hypothetical protein
MADVSKYNVQRHFTVKAHPRSVSERRRAPEFFPIAVATRTKDATDPTDRTVLVAIVDEYGQTRMLPRFTPETEAEILRIKDVLLRREAKVSEDDRRILDRLKQLQAEDDAKEAQA